MSACRFTSTTTPRVISGRHAEDCADRYGDDENGCRGCLPCPEDHCRVDGRTHVVGLGTCAECLAEVRDNLRSIAKMCDALPEEVEHRGVEGEAMVLLGPATNAERRGHLEASVLAGRVPWEAIETSHKRDCDDPRCTGCMGELHPETVLGTWEDVWRDALEHDPPPGRFNLAKTVDYLDRTLSYMADYPWVPFEDFAKALRRCVGHLEAVLHDGDQVDLGAPCMTCETELQRVWKGDILPWTRKTFPTKAREDGWACSRCKVWATEAQYQKAVENEYIRNAEWLTAEHMTIRTGVKASTVRSWAAERDDKPATVRKTLRAERVVYSVEDVERTNGKGRAA